MTENVEYLISRLEESLDRQVNEEGDVALTPVVSYCFDCDEIGVDKSWPKDGCLDHRTVSSDYEHAGIKSAITTLKYIHD